MSLYPNDGGAYSRAREIVRALGGQWHGEYGMACCPAHDDANPSLSVTQKNGRVLICCHARCSQRQVASALASLGLRVGQVRSSREDQPPTGNEEVRERDTRTALEMWHASKPGAGMLEGYLHYGRGIEIPIPDALRFHSGLRHRSGEIFPAMVALVTNANTGEPCGVHRTFLSEKAPVNPQKMSLGPCRGGVIRLAPATDLVMLAEGIETALSVMQAKKWPAWTALSASGFRTLDLPAEIKRVIVLADGDDSGEVAAKHAAYRWRREGRQVSIARPPRGLDFNDVLCGR
jgi:putative DNA primase/helicase